MQFRGAQRLKSGAKRRNFARFHEALRATFTDPESGGDVLGAEKNEHKQLSGANPMALSDRNALYATNARNSYQAATILVQADMAGREPSDLNPSDREAQAFRSPSSSFGRVF